MGTRWNSGNHQPANNVAISQSSRILISEAAQQIVHPVLAALVGPCAALQGRFADASRRAAAGWGVFGETMAAPGMSDV